MTKAMYEGVGGVARKVKNQHIGVGNVARKVKNGFIGVSGVARQFFGGGIGGLPVGTGVYMNYGGARTRFFIVHQGLPSSIYDESCNGTWLLSSNALERYQFDDYAVGDYADSYIKGILNGYMHLQFDESIRNIMKTVKIPYYQVNTTSVKTGASGTSGKLFLLSAWELGWKESDIMPQDGACLDYFQNANADPSLRVAYYDGEVTTWWTRTTTLSSVNKVFCVHQSTADYIGNSAYSTYSVRPCIIFPSDTQVDEEFNIIA